MSTPAPENGKYDVIIIGGSYAGMSAALQLVRARRKVLIIDGGKPRNRNARVAHGFLGREGLPPADIASQARNELVRYPTLTWLTGTAVSARAINDGGSFQVKVEEGKTFVADRVILAHGVTDDLPDIDGIGERWGRSVFHCPYCHGYEVFEGRIGVMGCAKDGGAAQALLLCDWGRITLFCSEASARIDAEQHARLEKCGVVIESARVTRVEDTATVVLADGRRVEVDALFISPHSRLCTDLAGQLGCELKDGGCITTDSAKQTTVPGVFACGDAARMAGSIALAVGEGALAGVAVHHSLMGLLE
ncbi:NAD(P)/FAD-dependent oxidoreductase [Stenotrophomonas sp.]|uniref:NAD(P)/FAD-dependent oxidoreductase n=1 Tax=Stenotrophomonas sp. TaxID=69392 RepID=UPI0029BD3235|nr:NAD(P)/FAD-dependent oxidoreductase [Stenotrophomonas sp.]MDX3934369.1 NAD(P)/FAD-dependent oxidoreductase [Stenotrophomonas sp.]